MISIYGVEAKTLEKPWQINVWILGKKSHNPLL
jgi:hypothetical protein